MMTIDAGLFTVERQGCKTAVFAREGAAQIRGALFENAGCKPAFHEGRGTVMRFPYLDGDGLVRRYERGGAVRFILKDQYLFDNRPLREFRVHFHVHAKGLPVPELLGVCWQRKGICFSGAIATREIPSMNLEQYLKSEPEDADDTLRKCGVLVRRLHDIGVVHADLQVRNILIGSDGPALIDFDNATLLSSVGVLRRSQNLLRLRRSFLKRGLSEMLFRELCEGYGELRVPPVLEILYRLKGLGSDVLGGRRS